MGLGQLMILVGALRRGSQVASAVTAIALLVTGGAYLVVPGPSGPPSKATAEEDRQAERDRLQATYEQLEDERPPLPSEFIPSASDMQEKMGPKSFSNANPSDSSANPAPSKPSRNDERPAAPVQPRPELRSSSRPSSIPSTGSSSRRTQHGMESKLIGGTGGAPFRSVSSTGKPIVGLAYRLRSRGGKDAVGRLEPLFDRDRPNRFDKTEIARDGYVLAAFEVDANEYVNALRPLFAKVKADGRLDTIDHYKGNWIGTPTGKATRTVGGGGAILIGIIGRRAIILDAIGVIPAL